MARPTKKVDVEVVKRLAERQHSDSSIAAITGVACSTLIRRFRKEIDEAKLGGSAKLWDVYWSRGVGDLKNGVFCKHDPKLFQDLINRVFGKVGEKVTIEEREPQSKAELVEKLKEALARVQAEMEAEES